MSLPQGNNIFHQFPNPVFIETGSYRGDGIQAALDAGFETIISIDIARENLDFCISRFDLNNRDDMKINLYCMDSGEELSSILDKVSGPITFWLDAHWQFIGKEPKAGYLFPLLKELEQISKHRRNDHTILIDDWHIFYPDRVGYSKEDIKRALYDINGNYKISFIDNPVKDGILVASL